LLLADFLILYPIIISTTLGLKSHLHPMVRKGLVGATLGEEVFSDLDYADDVALLTAR